MRYPGRLTFRTFTPCCHGNFWPRSLDDHLPFGPGFFPGLDIAFFAFLNVLSPHSVVFLICSHTSSEGIGPFFNSFRISALQASSLVRSFGALWSRINSIGMSSTFPHWILLVPLKSFLTLTTRYVIARGVGPRLFLGPERPPFHATPPKQSSKRSRTRGDGRECDSSCSCSSSFTHYNRFW